MKKLVEEVKGEGMEKLLGERVTIYCYRYIYTGKLVGVNESDVLLEDCGIVYDTGSFETKEWSDYQKLPNSWYIKISAIESYGILK